ncbi:MAG: hypothetical protein UX66_C0008G0013 [Parcubacteria group bacterium GW2011_GWF2_46_8]|nr:MAG: hypothetical protein UX66_C0008G0013 [Parcubacteria group bacterium GW2011_GWF2_46_8]
MLWREYDNLPQSFDVRFCQRVDSVKLFHFLVFKLDTIPDTTRCGHTFKDFPAHPERTNGNLGIGTRKMDVNKLADQVAAGNRLTDLKMDTRLKIVRRYSKVVYTRNRGDHDDVTSRHQGRGCLVTKFFDFFVDHRLLIDIGISMGHVCLGLIVIVVRYEIINRVFGEKILILAVELRGQSFVWRDYQNRHIKMADNIGHRECFTRSRHP